ncbi:Gfo/Idh/MocA family oxidoreductase [Mesorhizobium sp.]|uniref:Gfo/Idh/MocA family protein n=1 Tax=Mesorhizobium sp. TaxID=1871066 RepID=UPI00121BBF30|nr:Gfo/Idh/MocA family oxidoreductase [Mesorhizobium sp.]TIO09962.1 MAG: Gfo/Idh/MocA family oxidoreductase [Mesorhizobium sp.]TIO32528.1 MAG: Gfo/Idh/MocA family oxidoreductase [Mesorhizobium sp.]TIP09524.1 MAG: Gfo/Idh/MocA family oxidoreductase [Mesorhizobium sp.]
MTETPQAIPATGRRDAGKVRWAIVGASQIARSWVAKAIQSVPDAELVAVVSRSAARGRAFADDFGIPVSATSLKSLLAETGIDAVYVSTNNDRHCDDTLEAAASGLHVLCEKPLGLTLNDAIKMARACDRAGVVLATNHHMRGAATHRAIRDLVLAGKIGRPLAARAMYCEYLPKELQTWRTKDTAQGGVIYDLTVHNVDVLRFVLADEPVEVMSMKASSLIGENGVEDQVQSIVRFASGLIAYMHEGQVFAHHETALEVHGTEGSIYGRGILDEAPAGRVYIRRGTEMTEIPVEPVNLYAATIARFNAAVLHGEHPAATGWDGVASLATALAVRRSAQEGVCVPVPFFQGSPVIPG